jgi:ech hydrogenase subunit A
MNILVFSLILIPLVFSILFLLRNDKNYYKMLSYLLFAAGAVLSIAVAINGQQKIPIDGTTFKMMETIISLVEVIIIVFLYYVSIKYKRMGTLLLTVIQTIITIYSTIAIKGNESAIFNLDTLTLVMLLIVNIIGTLIVVFANGYISVYEKHRGLKNKQKLFYSVICLFIAAMNGLVLSDSLSWIYFFWEITTLSSFVLISYNGDEEALNSGFRALFLNLIGGIAFAVGNIIFYTSMNITSLSGIIQNGKVGTFYIIPVFLLCIAGFAKSAQVPFQSWLLGAMVAPTPVSALLHSSTMVKAGVYLIIKLSPAYAGTSLGTAIAIYGGFTFVLCSAIAVSQRNAKRVLAYSTIANLGLIICSAGMGTPTAVAAAIALLIFHAISKALLFLCTGQIEHTIGSRDIEDMTGLVHVAPVLALITAFGMVTMILPPFGVLVTKWLSVEASATNPFVTICLVLGSALTTLYYIKWLGTILSYPETGLKSKAKLDGNIYFPLWMLSIFALLTSIFIKPIYNMFVSPEIQILLKSKNALSISDQGDIASKMGTFNNGFVFIALIIVILLIVFVKKSFIASAKLKDIYMCGENNVESDKTTFRTIAGTYEKAKVSNFYLNKVIDEKALTNFGYIVSISILVIVLLGGLI